MKTEEIIAHIAMLAADRDRLIRENEALRRGCLDAEKFYDSALTTQMVAALHGVSQSLVRKYIELGMIETHPMSTDSKLLVRGSTALLLDFKSMRRQSSRKV